MKNNRKVVLFIAASLDGYIATKEDSLEWLYNIEGEGDNGLSKFYGTADTIIMGKRTYDWLLDQELESFPYKGKDCYVYTRSDIPDNEDVRFARDNVAELIAELQEKPGDKIWVMGGSELIQEYLEEDLIDEITVTVAPVIIGEGIPLFREGKYHLDLELTGTATYNQFVELNYKVKRS